MTVLLEREVLPPKTVLTYGPGDRVIWKAELNNGGHYHPDEKLSGTVISAFINGKRATYRIELDRVWGMGSALRGTKIVVGNITEYNLFPL